MLTQTGGPIILRHVIFSACSVALLACVTATPSTAQTLDKRTLFTLSGPVSMPGVTLPDRQPGLRPRQTIAFLTELYDNSNRLTHAVDFVATVRDVSDGRTVSNMRDERTIQAGNTPRSEGYKGEIPLKDFTPGLYVLRVEATTRTGNQFAFREVPLGEHDGAAGNELTN